MKKSIIPMLLLFCSCNPSPATPLIPTETEMQSILSEPVTAEQLNDFRLQRLNTRGFQNIKNKVKQVLKWYLRSHLLGYQKSPDLVIADVLLNGTSIQGDSPPGQLQPDWEGEAIELTLKGPFVRHNQKPLKADDFLFTLEEPLVVRSLAPDESEPKARILLDDAILLTPISITPDEIRVRLPQAGLTDLLLEGSHKITLVYQRYYADTIIQVGPPVAPPPLGALQPQIKTVELVRNNNGQARFLRCTGTGLMTQGKFSYAQLDGDFALSYQSQIVQTDAGLSYETLIHLPDPDQFDPMQPHTLTYATPFGVTHQQLETL